MFSKKKLIGYIFILTFVFSIPVVSRAATVAEVLSRYKNALKTGQKVNILIVPGHDDEYWGTEFGDVREGDITVAIGQHLYSYLKDNPRFSVSITRTQMGYTDTFKNYFANNRTQIQEFISTKIRDHKEKVDAGVAQMNEIVPHARANPEVAYRLYGINKWANENNIDLVIHLHINDTGGRTWGKAGKYTGFSMYMPDRQYSNFPVSEAVGKAIFNELLKKNTPSDYPPEAAGLIPDQELIAVGASNTLNAASVLIEYGYIYEKKFLNVDNHETLAKNFALQTSRGLQAFFSDQSSLASASYLPYTWTYTLKRGSTDTAGVQALQLALTRSGVYSCGITGVYGTCTEKGVRAFQAQYKLEQTGTLGPKTRAKLNALYSE